MHEVGISQPDVDEAATLGPMWSILDVPVAAMPREH
ncbi:hypothetical protein EYZ11_002922 [Aspergillus tanneri]|uniref:Uncharacterized protein n=1 Tax=Aspergillus tanneri TaxID=1220188 RepID=A0A4S3JRN9_9EURO|nr:hypothetical protein EYZ11_002922 [Aspergillus tanneri]